MTATSAPSTRDTENPVLVVGAKWDPATRYEGAVIAHGLLPNSALLTVDSWGHTSLFTSACADEAIAAVPHLGNDAGARHGLHAGPRALGRLRAWWSVRRRDPRF